MLTPKRTTVAYWKQSIGGDFDDDDGYDDDDDDDDFDDDDGDDGDSPGRQAIIFRWPGKNIGGDFLVMMVVTMTMTMTITLTMMMLMIMTRQGGRQ